MVSEQSSLDQIGKVVHTLDVGDQVAVDDAGARKKSSLDAGAVLRLRVAS